MFSMLVQDTISSSAVCYANILEKKSGIGSNVQKHRGELSPTTVSLSCFTCTMRVVEQ